MKNNINKIQRLDENILKHANISHKKNEAKVEEIVSFLETQHKNEMYGQQKAVPQDTNFTDSVANLKITENDEDYEAPAFEYARNALYTLSKEYTELEQLSDRVLTALENELVSFYLKGINVGKKHDKH